ncbi:MAG: HAD-IIIA family hydrolase, partial [Armatimonadetes bacterium]|nr:HAD-IIIA family hydrolase [Armatimonadota bacterium]
LALLARFPVPLVVATNQSIIGRGIVTQATLEHIHQQMLAEIRQHGGRIDRIYYCPHAPWENCSCRKPRPGLLLRAAEEMGLDLSKSWFIGDRLSDLEAGRAAGTHTVLIGKRPLAPSDPQPDHVASDLLEAARWLVRNIISELVAPSKRKDAPVARGELGH